MRTSRLLRWSMQRYWRWQRALTLGARGIVIEPSTGRILLVRHTYTPGWILPGGGVELGETIVDALRRELSEEANVTLRGEAELLGIYSNGRFFPGDHVAVYVVRDWHQSSIPGPSREIAEVAFFSPDRLPPDTTGGTRRRLAELLDGKPRSETW